MGNPIHLAYHKINMIYYINISLGHYSVIAWQLFHAKCIEGVLSRRGSEAGPWSQHRASTELLRNGSLCNIADILCISGGSHLLPLQLSILFSEASNKCQQVLQFGKTVLNTAWDTVNKHGHIYT